MKGRKPGFLRMTRGEYEANKNGLNIFFGAMLGVVMADVEGLPPREFAWLLWIASAYVVTILYISASRRRIVYSGLALTMLGAAWAAALYSAPLFDIEQAWLTGRLLPAFSVWTLMTIIIEFAPREREPVNGSVPTAS